MMPRWGPGLSHLGKWAGFWLIHFLDRIGQPASRREPADYLIDLENLYRIEAHWALTFSRLGTVALSAEQLRHLAMCLDTRSYWEVLRRSRRAVGPGTVAIVEPTDARAGDSRSVQVSDQYYGSGDPDRDAYYPYAMHPWVYALGWHRRIRSLRATRRRSRLFFAGVVNEGYAHRLDFPLMTRPEVVECVLDTFRADARVLMSRADLAALRRTDRQIVLILFRGDVTPTASNHFQSRPVHFRMLARSRFALCPPGVYMPHSHNLVEALAVGTVPVLDYSDFCRPRLIDGITCLAFTTPDELCAAVRRALGSPDEESRQMQAAAARYYDEELSPTGAAVRLGHFLAQAGPNHA